MNPWIAIVGTRESGKQHAIRTLCAALNRRGVPIGGFVQERVQNDGETVGYDAVALGSGDRVPLVRESRNPRLCRWGFDRLAFETARGWVLDSEAAVLTLEVGAVEAAGEGHWPAVEVALGRRRAAMVVLMIRPSVLTKVALGLPDPLDGLELPAPEEEIAAFCERVAEAASRTLGAA